MLEELLDWAFQRHLNPISWYIRPIFLLILCFFAYKRSWKGLLITFIVMTSSMVWFAAPDHIDPQMQQVLEFEKKVLSTPLSASITLVTMFSFLSLVILAFWKRSLKWGLIIVNITVVGKLILSLILTGEAGWGTFPVTIFGLITVNLIALLVYKYINGQESLASN